MTFRTSQEQSKWDSLQAQSSATIDKIIQGSATPENIQDLSRVISQLNQLAGGIFDRGISDAEATADTIVDRLNQDRIDSGKRPLTQRAFERVHKQTLKQVLQTNATDILSAVHDELKKHTADVDQRIDNAFERNRRAEEARRDEEERTNRIGDRTRQTQGSNDSRIRRTGTPPVDPDGSPPSSPDANPSGGNDSSGRSRMSITTFVRSALTSIRNATVEGWRNLGNSSSDDEEWRATVWLRKLKGMYGNLKDRGAKTKDVLGKIFGPMGKLLLLALTNPQLIATVAKAVSDYLNFDTVSTFMASTWKEIKETGNDVIDWIVKKVKEMFTGNKEAQAKAANSANTAEGRTAIAASVAKDSQIPANTSVAQARAAIPELTQRLKARKVMLAKAQARLAKDPSDQNKISVRNNTIAVQILQGQLDNYNKVLGRPTTRPADVQTPALNAGASANVSTPGAAGVGAPAGGDAASGRTTVMPAATPVAAPALEASSASTTATASYPKMTDGQALPPKEEAPVATPAPQDKVAAGGGIVSLRSFGFQSADDSLNILNMGMIG